MDHPKNLFKEKLRSSQAQLGLWLGLADPYAAEICAGAGFEWLLLDGEHAPNDLRSWLAQLQAVEPYGTHAVVRPRVGDATLIKQILDLGVQTVLIPMVETAEQAKELVQAMRYPPSGIRGVGSAIARASRFSRIPNYLRDANSRMCLLVQIESLKGIENLDEIAAVEGVDGVFIGPADLSAALGHLGNPTHPEVQSAIEDSIARILAAGKAPGILMADQKLAKRYIDLGCRFIAIGTDITILVRGTQALIESFKPATATTTTTNPATNTTSPY